ncbi:MAG: YheU family protein [Pseudomonadota bacterium]
MAQRIPPDALNAETLDAVLAEIATRDGTDYGEVETPLTTRVEQLRSRLANGVAVLVFDEESETCSVVPPEQAPADDGPTSFNS